MRSFRCFPKPPASQAPNKPSLNSNTCDSLVSDSLEESRTNSCVDDFFTSARVHNFNLGLPDYVLLRDGIYRGVLLQLDASAVAQYPAR